MKKRDRQKKKADMPEFSFKDFTPDEGRIYEEAMNSYRAAMASGKTLQQAYDGYTIEDPDLRSIIQADFLKIMIAERFSCPGRTLPAARAACQSTSDRPMAPRAPA